jgi:hypothetical protein
MAAIAVCFHLQQIIQMMFTLQFIVYEVPGLSLFLVLFSYPGTMDFRNANRGNQP